MDAEHKQPTVELPFHDSVSLGGETKNQSGTSSGTTLFIVHASDTGSRKEPPLAGSARFIGEPDEPAGLEDWNIPEDDP